MKFTILGAGLAGLSCSYHLGHEKCIVFEKNRHVGGHIYSHLIGGSVWDEGPHISFTKNSYVRRLLEDSVNSDYLEYEAQIGNWHEGSWIPHPAQTNLYALPKELADRCLEDLISARREANTPPRDYEEWLTQAFGKTFSETFPAQYTLKYWTLEASSLGVDWIGERVHYPTIESVKLGHASKPPTSSNYISMVRYPREGGYFSYANGIKKGCNARLNTAIKKIYLDSKKVELNDGTMVTYEFLINTLPLNQFVALADEAPRSVCNAASRLNCTSVLLVNITGTCQKPLPYHWLYVYDSDFLSTRITQNQKLSQNNMPAGKIGLQVEVYYSRHRPLPGSHEEIARRVANEVTTMKLLDTVEEIHTRQIDYANIIFDHERRDALELILDWLKEFGLERNKQDLKPMTNWSDDEDTEIGEIALAGRFGEWKYHWSDDCILRGKQIHESLLRSGRL
jgi:protoporphyrinogen oxidase